MKAIAVLAKFFNTDDDPPGYQKKTLQSFSVEIRALDPKDRAELAALAAVEMGVEIDPA